MKAKFNILENYADRLITQKGSFIRLFKKFVFSLILSIFFLTGVSAQTIISFENGIQSTELSDAAHLQSLVTDIHPSVYLSNGVLTTYGTGSPIIAICDASSVNKLYDNDPIFNQVELIRITINNSGQIPSTIDLERVSAFTNLRYLLLVFAYDECGTRTMDCLPSTLNSIIHGASSPIIVLYNLSIPE